MSIPIFHLSCPTLSLRLVFFHNLDVDWYVFYLYFPFFFSFLFLYFFDFKSSPPAAYKQSSLSGRVPRHLSSRGTSNSVSPDQCSTAAAPTNHTCAIAVIRPLPPNTHTNTLR